LILLQNKFSGECFEFICVESGGNSVISAFL
jgi:hypothetical protein